MEKNNYELEIMNNIKIYSLLFGIFGFSLGVSNGKINFFDSNFTKKFRYEDDPFGYLILGGSKFIRLKYKEEIKGLVITIFEKDKENNNDFKESLEIIEFDNFDTIVIDSKKNDTKYAFHNSYCDVCIEENSVKEHFDLQKIQNGSQGNDDIKKLTNSFSVLDDKYNGILKYVQQACPNVSNSISTIMNEEVKSSIKK